MAKKKILLHVARGRYLRSVSDVYEAKKQFEALNSLVEDYCKRHGLKKAPENLAMAQSQLCEHLNNLVVLNVQLRNDLDDCTQLDGVDSRTD